MMHGDGLEPNVNAEVTSLEKKYLLEYRFLLEGQLGDPAHRGEVKNIPNGNLLAT